MKRFAKYLMLFLFVFIVLFHAPVIINYLNYNHELDQINQNTMYSIGLYTGGQYVNHLKWVNYDLMDGLKLRDSYHTIGPIAAYSVDVFWKGEHYLVISDSTNPKISIMCGEFPLDDSNDLEQYIGKKFTWTFYGGLTVVED